MDPSVRLRRAARAWDLARRGEGHDGQLAEGKELEELHAAAIAYANSTGEGGPAVQALCMVVEARRDALQFQLLTEGAELKLGKALAKARAWKASAKRWRGRTAKALRMLTEGL